MSSLPSDWPDWTNGKPADVPWRTNDGQCACELHRQYEQAYGITVNEWYAQHPEIKPEWMERCGNCENFKRQHAKRHVGPEPTPKPVQRHVEPESEPVKQQAKPTPTPEPVAAKRVEQEEKQPMCQPSNQRDTTPTHDAFVEFVVSFAIKAVCSIAALPFVIIGFIVALLWKHRHHIVNGVLAVSDAVGGAVLAPFEMAYNAATAPKRESYIVDNAPLMLTGTNAITDPTRLLDVQPADFIEISFAQRPEPVAVRR